MIIKWLTLEDDVQWDTLVQSFPNYDAYYLSGYVKAFEKNNDGKACLVYLDNGGTRMLNVFMLRDVADDSRFSSLEKNRYFDIVTPYGYGGPLTEGDEVSQLGNEYGTVLQSRGIISEFVRFDPLTFVPDKAKLFYELIPLGNTVYLDLSSEDVIWGNITSKNRNVIRKAQKNGVAVEVATDRDIIPEFMEIYNETMKRDNAEDYYFFDREFYDSIYDDFGNHAVWFYARIEEKVIATSIFLFANGNMHYHLSASRKEYQNLAPTNLLLYEAAKWGLEHGCSVLHLGGGVGSAEDSLYRFKKAFNRNDGFTFHIGKKIYDNEKYEYLLSLREKDGMYKRDNFFPKYRG